jgi:peptide deformylase
MILPVFVYGSPVLRKKAVDIDKDYEGLSSFIANLWETMYHADGIGLAAPQLGKSIRMFVIDASPLEDDDPTLKDFKKIFINAQILEREGEPWTYTEGCISIPNIREEVNRPSKVHIQYYDENWQFHDEYFEGIPARIIQHEYDHLEGILFVDLISPLKRKLIKGKLLSITKGKVDVKYKIKAPKQ